MCLFSCAKWHTDELNTYAFDMSKDGAPAPPKTYSPPLWATKLFVVFTTPIFSFVPFSLFEIFSISRDSELKIGIIIVVPKLKGQIDIDLRLKGCVSKSTNLPVIGCVSKSTNLPDVDHRNILEIAIIHPQISFR